ncbi:MAG: hypothetical protein OEX19_05255, partial [Gammaproteobacteria bacterium]|nr:hypothetical protein [Gammaproteobacteria bacterium]
MLKHLLFLMLCFLMFVQDVFSSNATDDLEIRWSMEQKSENNRHSLEGQGDVLPSVDSRDFRQTEIAPTTRISAFEMTGSRVLDKSVLLNLLGRYLGIPVSNSVLSDILNTINTYYADNAYLHSRVSIDENRIADGVVRLTANEAKVTRLQLKGNRSIDKTIIMKNFEDPLSRPVNKFALSNAVASLKQNALISDVNAYLYPVDESNNYALLLDIEERRKNAYVLMFNNYLSPSVGAENLRAEAMIYNKLGLGDEISFNMGLSQGVYQFGMTYRMPLRR